MPANNIVPRIGDVRTPLEDLTPEIVLTGLLRASGIYATGRLDQILDGTHDLYLWGGRVFGRTGRASHQVTRQRWQ